MDVLRNFYKDHRALVLTACVIMTVSIVVSIISWRMHAHVLEQFQTIAAAKDAAEKEMKAELQNLPPEITSPTTPPVFQQENCATIKKTIDAMKLMGMSKDPKVKELAASQVLQTQRSDLEEKFRSLECQEFLDRIAAGEIPAPQTPPDMRPDILPSEV